MAERLLCFERDEVTKPRRAVSDRELLADLRVLNNLLATEDQYLAPTSNFFLLQKDLQPYMRTVVASWMLEVCEEQQREEEVLPLAMNYLDRVLSVIPIKRNQLQLIASSCMFIASKVREAFPIDAEKLVQYTADSILLTDLLDWEMLILQVLKWDTSSVIAHDFLYILAHHLPLDEGKRSRVLRHAQTLATMCAIDYSFSAYPPSVLACASIVSSVTEGEPKKIIELLHNLTSIDPDCIRPCCEKIERTLSNRMTTAHEDRIHHLLAADASLHQKLTTSETSATASTPTDVRDISLCQ